jgi:hypothetical protein
VSRSTFRFLPGLFLAAALIAPAAPRLIAQETTPVASSANQTSAPQAQPAEKN